MDNKTFIQQCVRGEMKDGRRANNVIFRGGVVYSYGTHYPLLIPIAGRWIVNEHGYSTTTARHISIARAYANYSIYTTPGACDLVDLLRANEADEIRNTEMLNELRPRQNKERERLERLQGEIVATREFLSGVKSREDQENKLKLWK